MSDITKQIPNEVCATISFVDTSTRTSYSTSQQFWEQNGIKVTNNKAASTTDVGDNSNPVQFNKSSEVIIEYPSMTKLVIDHTGLPAKYTDAWVTSVTVSNATAVSDGNTTTITFATPVDSLIFASMSRQCRAYSMTVYASPQEDPNQYLYEGFINQVKGCLTDGGGNAPTGYWERYILVGNQIGPSDYDYPTTKEVLTDITSIYSTEYTMTDGSPVYKVTYSSLGMESYAYKEVYSQ